MQMNSFTANVFKLLRGTAAAQLVGLLAIPLLARWFTPESFGALQAMQSLLALALVASAGRMEIAILSVSEAELPHLLSLCVWLCVCTSVASLMVVLLWSFVAPDGLGQLGKLAYLLPLLLLMAGLGQVLSYLLLRKKEFDLSAKSKVTQSFSYVCAAVTMGVILPSTLGLIIADAIGRLGLLLAGLRARVASEFSVCVPSQAALVSIWRKHQQLLLVSLPSAIINAIGAAYTPLVIFFVFDAFHAGQYALVDRLLGTPIAMICIAASQVYMTSFADAKQSALDHSPRALFRRLVRINLLIGAVPAVALFAAAPSLCKWLLGPQWLVAGLFAQALMPLMLCSFVVMPVNMTLVMSGNLPLQLAWDIGRLLAFITTWTAIYRLRLEPVAGVALHSGIATLTYVVYLAIADKALGKAEHLQQTV
jgi:O-antigen/teichoic acid export membrane protein